MTHDTTNDENLAPETELDTLDLTEETLE